MLRRIIASLLLAGLHLGFVSAAPITMQFTATGFVPSGGPETSVSGTIKWDAASPNDPVNTLTSIDLTIAGHTYVLGEIEFFTFQSNSNHVGIGKTPAGSVTGGTDDFIITWFLDSLIADLFAYAPASRSTVFLTESVSFGVTAGVVTADVPEPATGALLGLALGGVALMRRRRAS